MNTRFSTQYPLIPRKQTYVLNRKLISVHSVDRDYSKWPNSNHFGIELGEEFRNVQSMRLINFTLPNNTYTFSKMYENTKLSFTYKKIVKFLEANSGDTTPNNTLRKILNGIFKPDALTWNQPSDVTLQLLHGDTSTGEYVDYNTRANPTDTDAKAVDSSGNEPDLSVWNPDAGEPARRWQLTWEAEFTITIPDGTYNATELSSTLCMLMNQVIYNKSASSSGYNFLHGPTITGAADWDNFFNGSDNVYNTATDSVWYQSPLKGLKPFVIEYNSVENKLIFGVTEGEFTLNFNKRETYNSKCNVNKSIFNQYTDWGLPAFLGFEKEEYSGTIVDISSNNDPYTKNVTGGLFLSYDPGYVWLIPTGVWCIQYWVNPSLNGAIIINTKVSWLIATNNLNLNKEDAIYMEVDRYNNIDEIYPYATNTNTLYNNDGAYRVNGSFAKIPIINIPFSKEIGLLNNCASAMFLVSDPPISRIDRLVFKFRYHNGRLVDFKKLPFCFTLELNMLKDEQHKEKEIRVPPFFTI